MQIYSKILKILRKLKVLISYYYHICLYSRCDYFDYKKISKPYPLFCISKELGVKGNYCYGNIKAVKNALGCNFDKHCMIEHGVYFGKVILYDECEIKKISTIYTYSHYRQKCLQNYYNGTLDKKVVIVGPYIKYAKNFYDVETLKRIKNKYGKILLVFPSHPDPENEHNYDIVSFVEEIERIKKDFDSVFISMYWLDIVRENYKLYEKLNYHIVCSGNRNDPLFLSRQKDLIELSDMTISNDIGTHIGYCIALNKPHYLFKQNVVTRDISFTGEKNNKEISGEREKEYERITNAFNKYSNKITKEQMDIVDFFWGKNVENGIRI